MKYLVTVKSVKEQTFLVDANSRDEADEIAEEIFDETAFAIPTHMEYSTKKATKEMIEQHEKKQPRGLKF